MWLKRGVLLIIMILSFFAISISVYSDSNNFCGLPCPSPSVEGKSILPCIDDCPSESVYVPLLKYDNQNGKYMCFIEISNMEPIPLDLKCCIGIDNQLYEEICPDNYAIYKGKEGSNCNSNGLCDSGETSDSCSSDCPLPSNPLPNECESILEGCYGPCKLGENGYFKTLMQDCLTDECSMANARLQKPCTCECEFEDCIEFSYQSTCDCDSTLQKEKWKEQCSGFIEQCQPDDWVCFMFSDCKSTPPPLHKDCISVKKIADCEGVFTGDAIDYSEEDSCEISPLTSQECAGKNNKDPCGEERQCPSDKCDPNYPYLNKLDYPDSGHDYCEGGICKKYSCGLLSSQYSSICDKDDDGDGDPDITDPNPNNPAIYTGAKEVCDGLDNDGNGKTDDDLNAPLCQKQEGVCNGAKKRCISGEWQSCSSSEYGVNYREVEVYVANGQINSADCDSLDNDCDATIDEGCNCNNGDTKPCGSDVGSCSSGLQQCQNNEWGMCANFIGPKQEICNSLDDDCDGIIDENENNDGEYTLAFSCNWNSCQGEIKCRPGGSSSCILKHDADSDEICNELDNCIEKSNPDQKDSDKDGIGDLCDTCIYDPQNDADSDTICGDIDNCPTEPNADQDDLDSDSIGDKCDFCPDDSKNDADSDNICGNEDNCPNVYNPSQNDCDSNKIGDACDMLSQCVPDSDKDGLKDNMDNCIFIPNPLQEDMDGDRIGDSCDPFPKDRFNDIDKDSVGGDADNCPLVANYYQEDDDKDGLGNLCDICSNDVLNDIDSDTLCGNFDNCPNKFNPSQTDCDKDNIGDACDQESNCSSDSDQDGFDDLIDNCAEYYNPDQKDVDKDTIGNKIGDDCDLCPKDKFNDIDTDGICGDIDNCPNLYNPGQKDYDKDGRGDICDICQEDKLNDLDNDGVCGNEDNCPLKYNPSQTDCDDDKIGDVCDADSDCSSDLDKDGIKDQYDKCPEKEDIYQIDRDGDGIGDYCDFCPKDPLNDIDQDGVCGDIDNCPSISNQNQFDSDKDNLGNLCDMCMNDPENDKDNDLICGNFDNCPTRFNPSQLDCDNNKKGDACDTGICIKDYDNDGLKDNLDNCAEVYNKDQKDSDKDGIGDSCDFCPYDKNNDKDQDGVCGESDNCINIYNPNQEDSDNDKIGDICDLCPKDNNNDLDEDGICGDIDNCPHTYNPNQEECEDIVQKQEKFDNVLKLKKERLNDLIEKSLISISPDLKNKIQTSSDQLKNAIKVENKEHMIGDKKFTKYKITINVKEPVEDMVYYQNIPKCMAEKAENIYFNGKNYNIIEKDPVIAWHFTSIQNKIEMTYDVEGSISDECINELRDYLYSTSMMKKSNTNLINVILPLLSVPIIIFLVIYFQKKEQGGNG